MWIFCDINRTIKNKKKKIRWTTTKEFRNLSNYSHNNGWIPRPGVKSGIQHHHHHRRWKLKPNGHKFHSHRLLSKVTEYMANGICKIVLITCSTTVQVWIFFNFRVKCREMNIWNDNEQHNTDTYPHIHAHTHTGQSMCQSFAQIELQIKV